MRTPLISLLSAMIGGATVAIALRVNQVSESAPPNARTASAASAAASMPLVPPRSAVPLELKGFRLGQPFALAKSALGDLMQDCKPDPGPGYGCSRRYWSYAGQMTKSAELFHLEGNIEGVRLLIEPRAYQAIVEALEAKYGRPQQTTSEKLRNAMGAEFQQETILWELADGGRILASKYAGSTDTGFVLLDTKRKHEFDAMRDAARNAKAKKDI